MLKSTLTTTLLLWATSSIETTFAHHTPSEGKHFDPFPFDPGFDIRSVAQLAESLPSHSWEYGTASEILLELYNPSISIYGEKPFPVPCIKDKDMDSIKGLKFAKEKIELNMSDSAGIDVLTNGDGATGDPASLGVSALMLGKSDETYFEAAKRTMENLVGSAPRWENGAISHRSDEVSLWADFVYMAPPFLAYYAVETENATLLQEAVDQTTLYRDILSSNSTSTPAPAIEDDFLKGLWHHIIGPSALDYGLWSTGNAWAAAGMSRVLATIEKAPHKVTKDFNKQDAINTLHRHIEEIIFPFTQFPETSLQDGLTKNYLESNANFGEIAGSSHMAAVIYRLAVQAPEIVPPKSKYIEFADQMRNALGQHDTQGTPHITANGTATPSVDPLCWQCDKWTAGSPEGNNFVVSMYAAWRDCIWAGVCEKPSESKMARRTIKFKRELF